MKAISLGIICALALTVSAEEIIELNEYGCPTNYKIPAFLPHEYCNKFYQCVNGVPHALSCPNGLAFNIEEQVCDWIKNIDCEGRPFYEADEIEIEENKIQVFDDPSVAIEVCKQENTEYILIAHEHCDKFYKCWIGAPLELNCPNNLLFNVESGICDWPANTECQNRIKIETIDDVDFDYNDVEEVCKRSEYNGALLPHDYCNWFYVCSNGRATVMECPQGLVYNIEEKSCDWSLNVECRNRTIAPREEIESSGEEDEDSIKNYGHSDPSEAVDICKADKSDGILIAHENCNQFYKCWNGEPHAFDCNPNLHYNPENGICDWPANVDCGTRNV